MKEENKIKQYVFENEAARRLLEFLMQENAILKTRLAGLLEELEVARELLEQVEQYQEWLLQNDHEISFVRQRSAELEKMLFRQLHDDGLMKSVVLMQKQMRKDLRALDEAFSDLKMRFNQFVESVA
ncbi:hypothetical protein [Pseudoflavitalea rhizosphaerae]|uniref:hypothetical protein n=1 Tax=Pseudoflavitalea rhizosphaerae TaxID=1884793 RepID=UPI000F8D93E5|nr:hypothetical protein [Pseudoflavitalea rhizosphaerae]